MMNSELLFGEVSESKPGYVRVKFLQYDGLQSDWLQVVKLKAKSGDVNYPLDVGELVVCIMLADEYSRADVGVCLGALSNDEDAPDSDAGENKYTVKLPDGSTYSVKAGDTQIVLTNKVHIANGNEDMKTLINDLISVLKNIMVDTAVGPGTLNAAVSAQLDNINNRFNQLFV